MSKGFPHTRLFGLIKVGWKDLGEVEGKRYYNATTQQPMIDTQIHYFCKSNVRIGRDHDGTLFKYCPRCMVKVD